MIKDAPSWLLWTQGDEKKSAAANSIGTSEVVNLADKINVDCAVQIFLKAFILEKGIQLFLVLPKLMNLFKEKV